MRILETKIYTIDEHPNKEACYEWVRNNWYDLGEHTIYDAIASLKALAEHLDMTVDYSIDLFGDQSEHVTFCHNNDRYDGYEYDFEQEGDSIYNDDGLVTWKAFKTFGYMTKDFLSGNCSLTGVCYDEILIDAFREAKDTDTLESVLSDAGYNLLRCIHNEGDYIYSDEGLHDLLVNNEYEFTENGKCV